MRVRIVTGDSREHSISVPSDSTLDELRERIWSQTGISPFHVTLTNRPLGIVVESTDGGLLADWGIVDGMTLQLVEGATAEEYYQYAVQYLRTEALKALIEREGSLDVNYPDQVGRYNPLFYVMDPSLMETLAGVGANVDALDLNGYPVLHTILDETSPHVDDFSLDPFLQAGVRVDATKRRRTTPQCALEASIERGLETAFEQLVEAGAPGTFTPEPGTENMYWSNLIQSVLPPAR